MAREHLSTRLRRRLWPRAQDEQDLADEIRFHLQQEAQLRIDAGVPGDEASAAAQRDFGNVLVVTEITRGVRTWTALESCVTDLRYGLRLLARNRVFAAFSVLSLALGIGATSAIFSLFDAIVLRPLPVTEPDRLVALSFAMPGRQPNSNLPYPHFAQIQHSAGTIDGVFAWTRLARISVGVQGQTEIGSAVLASGGYHQTLGLSPALGRLLGPDDDRPGRPAVGVIGYGYWQRRFGGSPAAIGAGITINQVPFTIVGVEPRGFTGVNVGSAPDITLPLRTYDLLTEGKPPWDEPLSTWLEIMARLQANVSLEQATQELNLIFARVNAGAAVGAPADSFAARFAREGYLLVKPAAGGGLSGLRGSYERSLRLVLMMLAAVVLLASMNVATLLLSRSETRRHEIVTRLAIGASRTRIVRQLLTEAVLIAACSGALGLLVAWWASRALLRVAMPGADALPVDLTPDARAIAFTLLVSGVTCVVFGLMPALRAASYAGSPARVVGGPRRRWLERGLVASQTALSVGLLVFASLFVRSLQNLWAQDTGYDRTNVLMFSVDAALAGKRGPEVPDTYLALLSRVQAIPGARVASISSVRPVSDSYYFIDTVRAVGSKAFTEREPIRIAFNNIGPGYFETLGIPLLAGRDFTLQDGVNAPRVAIISERLARQFDGPAVGQTIQLGGGGGANVREVVGVARDSRYANVKDAPRDVVYLPMFQTAPRGFFFSPTFEIRHAGAVDALLPSIRDAVAGVDPSLAVFRVKTLEAQTRESLARERLLALVSSYVGAFALLLACIGLYGLMMYTVAQRTRELGLRMALGSRPSGIRRLVLTDSALTVLAGAVAGVGASLPLVTLAQALLYEIDAVDPWSFAAATLLLLVVASAAAYLPALRASRINPIIALRQDGSF